MVCKLGPQSLREHPSEEQSHRLTLELFLTDPRVTQTFRVRRAWLFISSERLPSSIVEEAATTPKAADLLRPRFRSWRQAAVCPQRVEKQTPLGSKNHFSSPKADMIVSQVFFVFNERRTSWRVLLVRDVAVYRRRSGGRTGTGRLERGLRPPLDFLDGVYHHPLHVERVAGPARGDEGGFVTGWSNVGRIR